MYIKMSEDTSRGLYLLSLASQISEIPITEIYDQFGISNDSVNLNESLNVLYDEPNITFDATSGIGNIEPPPKRVKPNDPVVNNDIDIPQFSVFDFLNTDGVMTSIGSVLFKALQFAYNGINDPNESDLLKKNFASAFKYLYDSRILPEELFNVNDHVIDFDPLNPPDVSVADQQIDWGQVNNSLFDMQPPRQQINWDDNAALEIWGDEAAVEQPQTWTEMFNSYYDQFMTLMDDPNFLGDPSDPFREIADVEVQVEAEYMPFADVIQNLRNVVAEDAVNIASGVTNAATTALTDVGVSAARAVLSEFESMMNYVGYFIAIGTLTLQGARKLIDYWSNRADQIQFEKTHNQEGVRVDPNAKPNVFGGYAGVIHDNSSFSEFLNLRDSLKDIPEFTATKDWVVPNGTITYPEGQVLHDLFSLVGQGSNPTFNPVDYSNSDNLVTISYSNYVRAKSMGFTNEFLYAFKVDQKTYPVISPSEYLKHIEAGDNLRYYKLSGNLNLHATQFVKWMKLHPNAYVFNKIFLPQNTTFA